MFAIDTSDNLSALYHPQRRDNVEICITTSPNSTTHVWNVSTGDLLCSLQKNRTKKNGIAYLREQQYVICAQTDRPALNIYDLRKEEPVFVCSLSEKITCVTTYGNFCFGGSESGAIYVWDLTTGELLRRSEAHLRAIECIVVESGILATGGADTLVNVWSIADFLDVRNDPNSKISPMHTLTSHALTITSLRVTPTYIITTSVDRTLKIHDIASGTELMSITFPSSVICACIDASEHLIRAGCANGKIYEVNIYPNAPTHIEDESESTEQVTVAIRTSTSQTGTQSFSIENSSTSRKNKCRVFSGHTDAVNDINLSVDGCTMISCSKDGKAIVWDTRNALILYYFKKHMVGATDSEVSNSVVCSISQIKHSQHVPYPLVKPLKKYLVQAESKPLQVSILNDHWNQLSVDNEENVDLITSAWHESRKSVAPVVASSASSVNDSKVTKLQARIKMLEETNRKQLKLNEELEAMCHKLVANSENNEDEDEDYFNNVYDQDGSSDDEEDEESEEDGEPMDYRRATRKEMWERAMSLIEQQKNEDSDEVDNEYDDDYDSEDDQDYQNGEEHEDSSDEEEEENDASTSNQESLNFLKQTMEALRKNQDSDDESKGPIVKKGGNHVDFKFNFDKPLVVPHEKLVRKKQLLKKLLHSKATEKTGKVSKNKHIPDDLESDEEIELLPTGKSNKQKSLLATLKRKRENGSNQPNKKQR